MITICAEFAAEDLFAFLRVVLVSLLVAFVTLVALIEVSSSSLLSNKEMKACFALEDGGFRRRFRLPFFELISVDCDDGEFDKSII